MEQSFHLERIMQHPLQYETCKMMMGIGRSTFLDNTVVYCFHEHKTALEEVEHYIGNVLNQLSESAVEQIIDGLNLFRNRAARLSDTAAEEIRLPTGKDPLNSLDPHWIQIERCPWNGQYAEYGAIICCRCPWNDEAAIYIIVRGQEPTRILENNPPGIYPTYDAYTIWNQNDYFVDPAENNPYDKIELQPVETLLKELVQNAYSPVENWYRMQIAQISDPVISGRVRDDCALSFELDTFLKHSCGAFLKDVTCWTLDFNGEWINAGLRSDSFGIVDILAYQQYYFQPDGCEPTMYRLPNSSPLAAPAALEDYIKDILQCTIYNRLLRFSNHKTAPSDTPPNYAAVKPTYTPEVFSLIQSMLLASAKGLLYGLFRQLERGIFSIRVGEANFLKICPNPSQQLAGWIDYYMPEKLKELLPPGLDAPLEEKPLQPLSDWHPNIRRDFRPLQLNMCDYTWDVEVTAQRKLFARDLELLSERFAAITIEEARLYSINLHKLRGLFIRLWTDSETVCLWQSTLEELTAIIDTDYPDLDDDPEPLRDLDAADKLHTYGVESTWDLFDILENWELNAEEQLAFASENAIEFWLDSFSKESVNCMKNKKVPATIRMQLEAFPYGSVREPLFGTMHQFLDIITSTLSFQEKLEQLDESVHKFQAWYAPLTKIMHELSGRDRGVKNGQEAEVKRLCGEERRNAFQTVWRTLFKNCEPAEAIDILLGSLGWPCVHLSWKDFTYYLYWGWKAAPAGEYSFLGNKVAFITAFKSKQTPYLTIVKSEVASMSIEEFETFLREVLEPAKDDDSFSEADIDEKIDELIEAIEESITNKDPLQ